MLFYKIEKSLDVEDRKRRRVFSTDTPFSDHLYSVFCEIAIAHKITHTSSFEKPMMRFFSSSLMRLILPS